MKLKSILMTGLSILLTAAITLGSFPVFSPPQVAAAAGSLRGDVTGDGIIDGRDALKILSFIEGYETPTEDEIAAGDVQPVPGTDGRLIGDGQLTPEDAQWILQYSVGLISEGEVTGDFSNSAPLIYNLDPAHGAPGTQVTVLGENFVAANPAENIVYFGNIPAPVISATGTQLVFEVPEDAESSVIKIVTPAGAAESPADFTVTTMRDGMLQVPAGMTTSNYDLVNKFGDEAEPAADGRYQITTDVHGVTLISAMPKDGSDKILLAIDLTDGTTPAFSTINFLSTAEAMVFISPYFATMNAERALQMMPYIKGNNEVRIFAQTIEFLYANSDAPFEDHRFEEAYTAAVASVIESMPDNLVDDMQSVEAAYNTFGMVEPYDASEIDMLTAAEYQENPTESYYSSSTYTPMSVEGDTWNKDSLNVYYPDAPLTGASESSSSPGSIAAKIKVHGLLEGWSPVDWLVHVAQVDDPYDMFLNGSQSIVAFDSNHQVRRDASGLDQITFVSSNSVLKYIDLFGCLFEWLWGGLTDGIAYVANEFGWESLTGAASPDSDIHVPADTDSVYIVRNFSGILGLGSHTAEYNYARTLPDGTRDFWIALAYNVTLAAIDAGSVFVDIKSAAGGVDGNKLLKTIISKTIKKAVVMAVRLFPNGVGNLSASEICKEILGMINSLGMDIACTVTGELVSQALEGSVWKLLKFIGKSLDPLYKFSVGGMAVERSIAMLGFHKNASPLETWVMTVGTPFKPTVTALSVTEGSPGDEITLTGKNFDYRNKDFNDVRFGTYWQDATKVEVLSVNADGTELRVKLPHDIEYGEKNIFVKTQYSGGSSQSDSIFTVKRIPKLNSISPAAGFSKAGDLGSNPFSYQNGDAVTLSGTGFLAPSGEPADIVYFGSTISTAYTGIRTKTEMKYIVPELSPGDYSVYIDSPQWGVETTRHTFTVLGAPTVSSVTPTEAMAGQRVTLTGTNFGYNTNTVKVEINGIWDPVKVISANGTTLTFQMPSIGNDGEVLPLVVYTPGGTSEQRSLTRLPGVTVPELETYPGGYIISVDPTGANGADGRVSLGDALAFASGAANPFTSPWDDQNEIVTEHWHENSEHEWSLGQTTTDYEPATNQHESRRFMRIDYYYDGQENGPYPNGASIDLDVAEEDREEGDYVYYSGGDPNAGGANYKDSIYMETPGTYSASAINMPDQDYLYLTDEPDRKLVLNGALTLGDGSVLCLGIVEGGGIVINGNSNYIEKLKLQNVDGHGITINGGLGNGTYASSYYEDVTVENATGCGVYINGGGKNTMYPVVKNAGSHGIYVKNGEENVAGGYLENCTGNGILVEGGRNNDAGGTITGCEYGIELADTMGSYLSGKITDNRKSGVYMHGGENHVMCQVDSMRNQLHGIELENIELVKTDYSVYSVNNTGDGIHLGSNCAYNLFDQAGVSGNENGIYVAGSGTHDNRFESYFGVGVTGSYYIYDPGPEDGYFYGNRANGIVVTDGAHDNEFVYMAVYGSGEYGVLVTGEGTDNNYFEDVDVGMEAAYYTPMDHLTGNVYGGVYIGGGASGNVFYDCTMGRSEGNGVTITGAGTDDNVIERSKIGCMIGNKTIDEVAYTSPWKNDGYGVVIENGALRNEIINCDIGVNLAGGIKVDGLSKTWQEDEDPYDLAYLYLNYIGYGYTGSYTSHREALNGISGDGITVLGSNNIYLQSNRVTNHQKGIYIGGTDSADNTIIGGIVKYSVQQGIYINGSSGDYVGASSTYNSGHGLHLNQTQDTHIEASTFDNNGGDGIYLYQATDTSVEIVKLSEYSYMECSCDYNNGNGMHIDDSDNVYVFSADFRENGGHGILIDNGSTEVLMESPDLEYNLGSGLYIDGVQNIYCIPDIEDELFLTNNTEDGVVINNSQHVQIGQANRAVCNISGNGFRGVLIEGDETEDVSVEGIEFIGRNDLEAVKITGGHDITIGGSAPGKGNSIELSSTGILITGTARDVYIIGNTRIGEWDEWGRTGDQSDGNDIGIDIVGDVSGVQIIGNRINDNRVYGISISGGAHDNYISGNTIIYNGTAGVHVDGSGSVNNAISQNSISNNNGKGISLANGGNGMAESPVITAVTWRGYTISGTVTAPKGSMVEVYADDADEGEKFLGTSRLFGNCFYINADVPEGRQLHAIVVYPDGNTSEFGPCNIIEEGPGKIAFTSSRDGNEEIYLLDPGQLQPIRLTTDSAADYSPQISSNPDYILFVTDRNGNPDIWCMDTTGSGQVSLISDSAADYDPAWSFDNKHMAFVTERDGNPEIYTMDIIPGAAAGDIAYDDGYDDNPNYNTSDNDSSMVLFSAQPGLLTQIQFYIANDPCEFRWFVVNVENDRPGSTILAEGTTTPTETGWHTVDIPDLTIDSEFVVGLTYNTDGTPDLGMSDPWLRGGSPSYRSWRYVNSNSYLGTSWLDFLIRATVEVNPQKVTDHTAADRQPAWSPDGTKIAYTSNRAGNDDIWLVSVNGTILSQLTDSSSPDYSPMWSPDGSMIVFVSERDGNPEIYTIGADGAGLTRLTNNPAADIDPAWTIDGDLIVFSSDRDAGMELYQMNTNGYKVRRKTTSLGDNSQPNAGRELITQDPQQSSMNLLTLSVEDRLNLLNDMIVEKDEIAAARSNYTPQVTEYSVSPPPVLFSETTANLTIGSATVNPDGTVNIAVHIDGAADLGNIAFDVNYDSTAVRLTAVSAGDVMSAPGSLFAVNPGSYPDYSGTVRFNWINPLGYDGSGDVIILTFAVNRDAPWQDYDLTISNAAAYETGLSVMTTTVNDGILTVAGEYGDANGDSRINVIDLSTVARIILEIDDRTSGSDANQDGNVNVLDMSKIARKILGTDS